MDGFTTNRRTFVGLGVAAAALAAAPMAASAAAEPATGAPPKTTLNPDHALAVLIEKNAQFVADRAPDRDISTRRRLALAKGQGPFVTLVGCADSRVGPEHLFGSGLGEMFIVRTAGNYVDDAGFGSIAYSVAALGVPLIVVLGHERCGAVDAATKLVIRNEQLPPSLTRMVQPMLPAVLDARGSLKPGGDLLDQAVHMNVRHVVRGLRQTADPIVADPLRAGRVKVVGAYYDLDTGKVDFFDRA